MSQLSDISFVIDELFGVLKNIINGILELRTSDLITLIIIIAFISFILHLVSLKLEIIEHHMKEGFKK